jgi:outer membrane receptor protein involved in Fe transport
LLQDAGVILGVRNVLDQDPPSVGDSDPAGRGTRPGYEASIHDVRGRTVYLELRKAF